MLSAGARLGKYEIVARIRSGGMASLYLGRHSGAAGFARLVAIKVVHPHLAEDPSFVKMFIDEARLSARIEGPHVVHIEELGEANGTFFLVMEYVHGCALSQLLRALGKRHIRMTPELATQIAIQIADGLHAAHQTADDQGVLLGVVHRDVSPQNVLIAYRGHVKLIDFGIAKARNSTRQTTTGSIRGKLSYMPPEQAYGKPVDARADIYALGIILWEMLTMRRLFDGSGELAVLDQVRTPKVVAPSTLVEGIPATLDAAVMAALSPERDGRPATASDFRRMLGRAVPEAMTVDATEVAKFLAVVMEDEIAATASRLPDVVAASLCAPSVDYPDTILATMTREATGITASDFGADPEPVAPAEPKVDQLRHPARRTMLAGLTIFALIGGGVAVVEQKFARPTNRASAAAPIESPAPSLPPAASPAPSASPAPPIMAVPTPRPRAKSVPPARLSGSNAPPSSKTATHAASADPPGVHLINGVPIADKPTF